MAFVLCSLIRIERQFHQKSAGGGTHVLVVCGSAMFTLVSTFGFETVLGRGVTLDPARITAQIVSGIGLLGALDIFTRGTIVVGPTYGSQHLGHGCSGYGDGARMVTLAAGLAALPPGVSSLHSPTCRTWSTSRSGTRN